MQVEAADGLSGEQKTYKRDLFKCRYQVTPSDLFSFNSLGENLWITQCLVFKAIASLDELISVEHIEKPGLFAAAYFYRKGKRMPSIEFEVFVDSRYEQFFVFRSESSDDISGIQAAYNHFVRSMLIANKTGQLDADVQ